MQNETENKDRAGNSRQDTQAQNPEAPDREENGESLKQSAPRPWERSPIKQRINNSLFWITLASVAGTLVLCILVTALYQKGKHVEQPPRSASSIPMTGKDGGELVPVSIFYPSVDGLASEERFIPASASRKRTLEVVVEEYLKGPSGDIPSYMPEGTRLLDVYLGKDDILYLDISHEFRSGFQGDAYSEFLLLRGLYESVMTNAGDLSGMKILIEGKEVETIGGHISLKGSMDSVITGIIPEANERK